MNILQINSNYEQSKIYSNMSEYLIINHDNKGSVYYPVNKKFTLNSDKPNYLDVSKCLGKYDRLFYFYRNKKLLKDINNIYDIKQFSQSFAYSLFSNGFLAYTLYRKYNIPYIVLVQNTDVNMYFKKAFFLRNIGRDILNNASKIVFISEPYKNFVLKNFIKSKDVDDISRKSEVIPFGIDSFWLENIHQKEEPATNEIKLLFVGRINRNKNVLIIINAAQNLIRKGYKVNVQIVGDIEHKKIGEKIRNYEFVNYTPYANKSDLLKIYRESHIFIMPSIKESFGLVYAEAMSQGLPVIYTRGQGFDGHFEEGEVGYSVDCFNTNEIVDKIITIRNNYSSISSNCIREVKKFSWSNIIMKYNRIINK